MYCRGTEPKEGENTGMLREIEWLYPQESGLETLPTRVIWDKGI